MHPLNAYLAQEIIRNDSRVRAAEQRTRRPRPQKRRASHYDGVTIRRATQDDCPSLERLAQLEGRSTPRGPALVAEVDKRLLAARWLEQGLTLADPFRPTAELAALLDMRAGHLGYRPRLVMRPFRLAAALVRRTAAVRH